MELLKKGHQEDTNRASNYCANTATSLREIHIKTYWPVAAQEDVLWGKDDDVNVKELLLL